MVEIAPHYTYQHAEDALAEPRGGLEGHKVGHIQAEIAESELHNPNHVALLDGGIVVAQETSVTPGVHNDQTDRDGYLKKGYDKGRKEHHASGPHRVGQHAEHVE